MLDEHPNAITRLWFSYEFHIRNHFFLCFTIIDIALLGCTVDAQPFTQRIIIFV